MFNHLNEIDRIRDRIEEARHIEDFAHKFGHDIPKAAVAAGLGAAELAHLRRVRRCQHIIHKIVCCLLVVAVVAAAACFICNKMGIKKPCAKKNGEIDDIQDRKEMIQKLAKIKGKTAH